MTGVIRHFIMDMGKFSQTFSPRSGNSGNNSIATRLMCHGLAHCMSFAWDPGPGAGQCTYAVTVSV